MDVIERIKAKSHWVGECLICDYTTAGGYPRIRVGGRKGRMINCSRLMLEHHLGRPIAAGMDVAHAPLVCHNRKCVNPLHLSEKTRKDNCADKKIDKTENIGERNGRTYLTEEQVKLIKSDTRPYKDIMNEHNIKNQSTISNIKAGRSWKYVTS